MQQNFSLKVPDNMQPNYVRIKMKLYVFNMNLCKLHWICKKNYCSPNSLKILYLLEYLPQTLGVRYQ